jgi:hypothetical protein
MNEAGQKKVDQLKYNDYNDYKLDQENNNYFKKHGLLIGIIIGLLMFFALPFLTLVIIFIFSSFIPLLPSIIITLIGILMYFYHHSISKKNSFLIKEASDVIELSSPLYFDLLAIFSGFFILLGTDLILLNLSEYSNAAFYFGGTLTCISTYYFYQVFKKVKYSLFDKIMVYRDRIEIDNPYSKNKLNFNKVDLDKIVDLRIVNQTVVNKSGALYNRIFEFHLSKGANLEVDDEFFEYLRLDMDLFLESVKKMDYLVKMEIFVAGQDYRFDENGNKIMKDNSN